MIPTNAFALSWDGSSAGGTGGTSSASPNGYAIRTTSDNCIGYRFSAVTSSGSMKVSKVIDVFRNTSYGNLGYTDGYKFSTKNNKKQLISKQNNGFTTARSTTNCYKESSQGFSTTLPAPSGMETSFKLVHSQKTPSPIDVTPFGIEISVRLEHSAKA